jgi:hypothetical protein
MSATKVRCKRTGKIIDLPDGHCRHWYDAVPYEDDRTPIYKDYKLLIWLALSTIMVGMIFLSYSGMVK